MASTIPTISPLATDVTETNPISEEAPDASEFTSSSTRKHNIYNVLIENYYGYNWFSSKDIIDLKEVHATKWKVKDIFRECIYPGCPAFKSRLDIWLDMYGMYNTERIIEKNVGIT